MLGSVFQSSQIQINLAKINFGNLYFVLKRFFSYNNFKISTLKT